MMIKRFTIQPDVNRHDQIEDAKNEKSNNVYRQKELGKNSSPSSVKLWLLGGLCVGLAIGVFSKRR